ncbi:olfactory receptor 1020-like [Xenopus tropicalis]|uniref:Olfactory receptor n=1 Tax=Xenopus tropicalis TaxID=8364 RepID=A0A8J0QV00_XENTR|nr:olfactory receptor 1020-like [Xenopus tropicalis]
MYFFLRNLSVVDIGFSSTIVPKLLVITVALDKSVSLLECALQMYFHSALGGTDSMLLAVMAYDRFAAICKPLQYNTVMNKRFCVCMAVGCWTVGFTNAIIHVVLTFKLPFCRSHHLNHYFCEEPPFFKLSCQDTWLNKMAMYIATVIIGICCLFLTLVSYAQIIRTIINIPSTHGRRKAFSTCASHLAVISIFYGPILFIYLGPDISYFTEANKSVSIIYTVVTPMLNPIIYSIRNKQIKDTIRKKLASCCLKTPEEFP